MSKKSYKREIAAALLVFWVALISKVFFFSDKPADFTSMVIAITASIVPASLIVYGLHAHLNKDR